MFESYWSFQNGEISGFEGFLHRVIGFFIIESVVVNTTIQSFRPLTKAESMWEHAVSMGMSRAISALIVVCYLVGELIVKNLKECVNADLFLRIKTMVVLFMNTMEIYGYNASRLSELKLTLFERYATLLSNDCERKVVAVIENDEYAPMLVESRLELENIHSSYPLEDEAHLAESEYACICLTRTV